MPVLSKLACMRNRKDEEPNKDLARELVEKCDVEGIGEIAENLLNKDKRIQTDCLSVLEQVGLLSPELIEDYVSDLLKLIFNKNNRLVWAAMINLALIAGRKPEEIFDQFEDIVTVIERGSVITKDNGIKTLAIVASTKSEYNEAIFPFLLEQLKNCRPKSVPQYAESIRSAVLPGNQNRYIDVIKKRFDTLLSAQQRRVQKLLKTFEQT